MKTTVLKSNNIKYSEHKVGEETVYSFQSLWFSNSIAFIESPVYNYVQRANSQSNLKLDDPWGGSAITLKAKMIEMRLYDQFANTVNAFFLTAAAVSANCLAQNYSWSDYLQKIKACRARLDRNLDISYPIDKANMSMKAKFVGWLLQHSFYLIIWMLANARKLIH